jgi:hypothetical protein
MESRDDALFAGDNIMLDLESLALNEEWWEED